MNSNITVSKKKKKNKATNQGQYLQIDSLRHVIETKNVYDDLSKNKEMCGCC